MYFDLGRVGVLLLSQPLGFVVSILILLSIPRLPNSHTKSFFLLAAGSLIQLN